VQRSFGAVESFGVLTASRRDRQTWTLHAMGSVRECSNESDVCLGSVIVPVYQFSLAPRIIAASPIGSE
jgi:hypothetical protein